MKVTICFGNTRIVVPCGSGEISVHDLQQKACIRYRRAIGKEVDYAMRILKLESSDGGILDIEDMVYDVVEDKDKLIAVYEEEDPSHGDWERGSAASSEGKNNSLHSSHLNPHLSHSSSEFEQRYLSVSQRDSPNQYPKKKNSYETRSAYEHTETDSRAPLPHEKSLSPISFHDNHVHPTTVNQLGLSKSNGYPLNNGDVRQRVKSPVSDERRRVGNGILKKRSRSNEYFHSDEVTRQPTIGGSEMSSIVPREEVYNTSPNGFVSNTRVISEHTSLHPLASWLEENSHEVRFVNDGTVESISVREHFDPRSNIFVGLLVQAVTKKSPRLNSDCRLSSGDIIISINDHVLMNYGFNEAEALLTESLAYSEVFFRILSTQNGRQSTAPYSLQEALTSLIAPEEPISIPALSPTSIDAHLSGKRISSDSASSGHIREKNSLSRKIKATFLLKLNSSYPKSLSFRAGTNQQQKKSAGNQIILQLLKDQQGLGFSLTSNETLSGDLPGPLYVKEILSNGAAMKNGKLIVGDRLLEINGVSVLGKTHQDVVNDLRSIEVGSVVNITVSRHVEHLPRKLKEHPDVERVSKQDKEYFTYDVALNDTGSAGLGIGLKGNQNTRTGQDLGVFVRSVFHGGAAWQDGRLKANDQLIEVNGHSLRGISNQAAIGILRTSMSAEGNVRGMIQLTIARRKVPLEASRISSDASSEMSDLFPENERSFPKSDSSFHTKQSSLPELLLETSFGPNDISDVISHEFNSFTLGRIRNKDKTKLSIPYIAHSRSQSSNAEADTIDVELVNQVQQKILNSSSSSSSMLGNLLNSSLNSSGFGRAPPGSSYSTWTLPRTNRIPTKTLSSRNSEANTQESIVSALEEYEQISDFERSIFDKITARQLKTNISAEPAKESRNETQRQSNASVTDNKPSATVTTSKENQLMENKHPPSALLDQNIQPHPPTVKLRQHLTRSPPLQPPIRRSISTESMVLAADQLNEQIKSDKNKPKPKDLVEVGPCLGIAKSSSLESLQTAVESCIAEQSADPSRPLPKAVRGRVLNDSFRAALNRTYDLAEGIPLKQMQTPQTNGVPENYAPIIKSGGDSASKSSKKKSRFFSLFKTSKPKKPELVSPPTNPKISEKDEHKRKLEERKAKDFERMKEENERIQSKARELRQKQASERKKDKTPSSDKKSNTLATERSPSVPVTTMKRLEEFYVKEEANLSDQANVKSGSREGRKGALSPVEESKNSSSTPNPKKNRRRSKSENRKFKDASAAYNSLPRQPRRKNEPWDNDTITSSDASSVHRVDNHRFYSQNKPGNDPSSMQNDLPRALQSRTNIGHLRPSSPEKRAKSPASTLPNDRSLTDPPMAKPPRSNGHSATLRSQLTSPHDSFSRSDFMRKKGSNTKQNPKIRHSIYTDQPSAFSQYSSAISGQTDANGSIFLSPDFDNASSVASRQTASLSGLEVVERNRQAYYRLKQTPKKEGVLEEIEMSVPCNL